MRFFCCVAEIEQQQQELQAREDALAQRQANQAHAATAEEERLVEKAIEVDRRRSELKDAESALQAQHTQDLQGESCTANLHTADVFSLLLYCLQHSLLSHCRSALLLGHVCSVGVWVVRRVLHVTRCTAEVSCKLSSWTSLLLFCCRTCTAAARSASKRGGAGSASGRPCQCSCSRRGEAGGKGQRGGPAEL